MCFFDTNKNKNKGFLLNLTYPENANLPSTRLPRPPSQNETLQSTRVSPQIYFSEVLRPRKGHPVFFPNLKLALTTSRGIAANVLALNQYCKKRVEKEIFVTLSLFCRTETAKGVEGDVGCPFLTVIGTQKQLGFHCVLLALWGTSHGPVNRLPSSPPGPSGAEWSPSSKVSRRAAFCLRPLKDFRAKGWLLKGSQRWESQREDGAWQTLARFQQSFAFLVFCLFQS